MILRIEDTDKARSTDAFTQVILDGMAWLGLTFDEGPTFQGAGLARHQADADRLVAEGKAYLDDGGVRFTVKHEDITWADAGPRTDHLPRQGSRGLHHPARRPHAGLQLCRGVRRHRHSASRTSSAATTTSPTPPSRSCSTAPWQGRAGVRPRADDPRRRRQEAQQAPRATAVGDYQERFLPEANDNFLALLGWSPGHDRELFFELDELIDAFDMSGLQKKPAVFDEKKLEWMNSEHLKHRGAAKVLPTLGDPALAALPNAEAIVNCGAAPQQDHRRCPAAGPAARRPRPGDAGREGRGLRGEGPRRVPKSPAAGSRQSTVDSRLVAGGISRRVLRAIGDANASRRARSCSRCGSRSPGRQCPSR